jgi:hypothetical protein
LTSFRPFSSGSISPYFLIILFTLLVSKGLNNIGEIILYFLGLNSSLIDKDDLSKSAINTANPRFFTLISLSNTLKVK